MEETESSNLEMCELLADYAVRLLGSGATCIRIEKNLTRIASTWRKEASLTIMPRHVHLTLMDSGGVNAVTVISRNVKSAISYDLNTRLSRLSWKIADEHIPYKEAVGLYKKAIAPRGENRWWVLFAVSCANASFCRLFGGDFVAMGVVAFATLCGYYVKQTMLEHKADSRVVWIVCALISSVLGATAGLFGLGSTPEVAMATSVLYLVPGIPFINSFSDLIDRHYICAISRFIDASILTACLSIGLCGGMALMNMGMF